MIAKIQKTIRKYALLQRGERVVVALSGGADSCALLSVLHRLSHVLDLTIFPAHFHHGQRGMEADADEAFCRELTKNYGLSLKAGKISRVHVPRGISPEDYFRRQRYAFLDRVAAECAAGKIALGHHLCDQAETILLNILRGGGTSGLKGILPVRENKYIRPLIEVSRQEITDYLIKEGMGYRHDSSNESSVFLRNRVRHELIPFLKEKYNPSIEKSLSRMAAVFRREEEYFNLYIEKIASLPLIEKTTDRICVPVNYFKTHHPAIGYRLVKALLEGMAPEGGGFSFAHIEAVVHLITEGTTGKSISLPYRLVAQKTYGLVVIYRRREEINRDYEYGVTIPDRVIIKERRMILSVKRHPARDVEFGLRGKVFIDADKIKGSLILRNRRKGDRFVPMGMNGTQKIKKLFIDRKISRSERESIALLVDDESVLWIENLHLSERVKISPETKNVASLELLPLDEDKDLLSQENI